MRKGHRRGDAHRIGKMAETRVVSFGRWRRSDPGSLIQLRSLLAPDVVWCSVETHHNERDFQWCSSLRRGQRIAFTSANPKRRLARFLSTVAAVENHRQSASLLPDSSVQLFRKATHHGRGGCGSVEKANLATGLGISYTIWSCEGQKGCVDGGVDGIGVPSAPVPCHLTLNE